MLRVVRRWRVARKRRRLLEFAEEWGYTSPAELQELRDLQSPLRAKWGFFPK